MEARHKYNNPFDFASEKTEALEEAYKIFVEIFEEYALKNNLSTEEIVEFEDAIKKAYSQKKAFYLFENRLDRMYEIMNNAFCKTLHMEDIHFETNIYYSKKSHHLITNE